MIDRSSMLDPLAVEGPRLPTDTLRPAVSAQRVLLLDSSGPRMADLATGDIRRWENGPPVSVPCVSGAVDLRRWRLIQFQVLRDPRPTSVGTTLLSLAISGEAIDTVETIGGRLELRSGTRLLAEGPIGGSPAVVIRFEPDLDGDGLSLDLSARNAESATGIAARRPLESTKGIFTIGGPSTELTGVRGRRRLIPVHLDVAPTAQPVDLSTRVQQRSRRAAGIIRRRFQR